ncbi:unnamed protein product [Effrenium voratum]|uniref:PH domain-containing protein n=1 Tax=Effrenium voratum TaxID=2562239 RepID=A0AA36HR46_9DINO|nr:unnamed protein product [Effrenium voratum]CAJ1424420.1 unnamed protein product [Effrenium voratum]
MADSCGNLEGWLRKKSHHIGLWKPRFFRFDGRVLRYWKHQRLAEEKQEPRGEISLTGCHVATGCGDRRFVLRAPLASYDEELEAETCEQRHLWVCSLNAAALQQRLDSSAYQVTPQRLLHAKGMWHVLQEAVSAHAELAEVLDEEAMSVEKRALRYIRCGGALLQHSGEVQEPRQGRLVVVGRRVRDSLLRSREEGRLAYSAGAGEELWLLLLSSRVISEPGECRVLKSAALLEPPRDSNLNFEVLYAFKDPLDDSEPVACLPLLQCQVGDVTECKYGSGWSLNIFEADEQTGMPAGASWLITLETREECELWRKAAKAARWAARAQATGKKRAAEEALVSYDCNPSEWYQACSRRLKQVAEFAPPPPTLSAASRLRQWASPRTGRLQLNLDGPAGAGSIVSTASSVQASQISWVPTPSNVDAATEAVKRVLAACEEVCGEAEGLLEAALAKRPMRQDAAGAALRGALIPALSTVGRCWTRWNSDLPHAEARRILRFLEARRQSACSLGFVCAPLKKAVSGLSAELSLRVGAHLRRFAASLLTSELGERLRGPSARASFAPTGETRAPAQSSRAVSTLPVDFFTFVNSCLLEKDQDLPAWRLCCLRVAKFVIKEVQDCLRGWLWATLPEVPREWSSRQGDGLPTLLRRWFWGVTMLANAMPAFQTQCQELTAAHSFKARKAGDEDTEAGAEDSGHIAPFPELDCGSHPVPREWRFDREAADFESILEAFLWAACDVALGRWRRKMLNPAGQDRNDGQGSLVPSLNQLLSPNLQVLRSWLDPSLFEQLLIKTFLVCMGCYIVKLSYGTWLQAIRGREQQQNEALSQEAVALCNYFASMSKKPRGASDDCCLWEPGRVINVLHLVLQPGAQPRSTHRRPSEIQRGAPLPAEWKGPLGFEDALSKLVSVLSEGPLPLDDVLTWFTSTGLPGSKPFQELPRPVPTGCLYIVAADDESRRRSSSRSSSMLSFAGSRSNTRRLSGASCPGEEDHSPGFDARVPGGFNLFGQAARRESKDSASLLMSSAEAAAFAATGSQAVGLASEGSVCELRIEQDGAYGAFCEVSASLEDAASPGLRWESGSSRLRWVQLIKASPHGAPRFEVTEFQPHALQAESGAISLPLAQLDEVQMTTATSMSLAFLREEEGRPVSFRYLLHFECPSHVFRFRLVLQSWWAAEPIRETHPVVAYIAGMGGADASGGPPLPDELEEDGWRSLSPPLTWQVMEQRLGGLWREVRKRLEAS